MLPILPLNYAILKHFTKVEEASADDVIKALKSTYGSFKSLNYKDVTTALMTANANGILEESRFQLDENDPEKHHLLVYFKIHPDGMKIIQKYIN